MGRHRASRQQPGWQAWTVATLLLAPSAGAQGLAEIATPISPLAPGASLAPQQLQGEGIGDVFLGQGKKGPYLLSWKGLKPESELVSVDGRRLTRGADYQIDPASGALTFNQPLRSGSIARVNYLLDGAKAQRNSTEFKLPLSLNLLDQGDRRLSLSALYRGNPGAANPNGSTLLSLTGQSKLGEATELSSSLWLASNDQKGKRHNEAAYRFGQTTKLAGLNGTLSARFARAGKDFADAKEAGIEAGRETLDLGLQVAPAAGWTLATNYRQTDDLKDSGKGSVESLAHRLGYITGDGKRQPKLSFALESGETEKEDAVKRAVKSRFEIASVLGKKAQAMAFYEGKTGNESDRAETLGLVVSGKPSNRIDASAALRQRSQEGKGASTELDFSLKARPDKTTEIVAAYRANDPEASESDQAADIKVTAAPNKNVRIETSLTTRAKPGDATDTIAGILLETKPSEMLSVKTQLSQRTLPGQETLTDAALRVEQQKLGGLPVRLSGGIGQAEQGSDRRMVGDARLEISPSAAFHLNGQFRYETRSVGDQSAWVRGIDGKLVPAPYLSLSGAYKTRRWTGKEELDTTNASIAVKPLAWLDLTGSYQENPEDAKGKITAHRQHGIGLSARFGQWTLGSRLAALRNFSDSEQTLSTEFTLGIKLDAATQLTTGYQGRRAQIGQAEDTTYSLGFTHRRGDLSLMLGGQVTWAERNGLLKDGRPDYEARAQLGLRF